MILNDLTPEKFFKKAPTRYKDPVEELIARNKEKDVRSQFIFMDINEKAGLADKESRNTEIVE